MINTIFEILKSRQTLFIAFYCLGAADSQGITVFKVFIWGGISSDFRLEI